MKLNWKIKSSAKIIFSATVIFALIGFVERQQLDKTCNKVIVDIENQYDNFFLNERDILDLVTGKGSNPMIGKTYDQLDLKGIERLALTNPYVENAEAYKDMAGNLVIYVEQKKPIARLILNNGTSAYITEKGSIMPVSSRYAARVALISGELVPKIIEHGGMEKPGFMEILDLLHFIKNNEFWQAQVTELEIDRNKNIVMYPQVTRQRIEFGKAENLEEKFGKLMIFYEKILPHKGWNHYTRVNVNYKDQIICE
jgi:cell division protein FtsQ